MFLLLRTMAADSTESADPATAKCTTAAAYTLAAKHPEQPAAATAMAGTTAGQQAITATYFI